MVEPPVPDQPVAPTLYLGMDGTGVPVRTEEVVDRAGKQPDGSAKTREVKLVTVWSAEGRDEEGTPVRDAGRSATRRPSRARPRATPTRSLPSLFNAWSARRPGGVRTGRSPRGPGGRRALDLEPRR